MHEHPSQALLDMMTVREKKGRIEGLRVVIVGDIAHSRVARSNMIGFGKMGAKVVVSGPPTMIPSGVEDYGVTVNYDMETAIKDADVIMMLRIQKERQQSFLFPTEREYSAVFGLTAKRLELASKEVMVMHPGPMNRGVEIANDLADGPHSVILDQVTNGVAIRMALFYLLAGGMKNVDSD